MPTRDRLPRAPVTPESLAQHLLGLHNSDRVVVAALLRAALDVLVDPKETCPRSAVGSSAGDRVLIAGANFGASEEAGDAVADGEQRPPEVRERPSIDSAQTHEQNVPVQHQPVQPQVYKFGSQIMRDSNATTSSHGDVGQQLNLIKAKTMYNMVEEFGPGRSKKLLFLTAAQANLIASKTDTLDKMLEVLDVDKPQLVINLLNSNGSAGWLQTVRPPHLLQKMHCLDPKGNGIDKWAAGAIGGRSPFLSAQDERSAERRLDVFMADVLIPLAARTNAIVLACALRTECMLTDSFTRMYSVLKSQWGDKVPFTLMAVTTDIWRCYRNPDMNAYWRSVRNQSRAWSQRDAVLQRQFCETEIKFSVDDPEHHWCQDLDPDAQCLIIVDSVDDSQEVTKRAEDKERFSRELVRHLGSTIPSIALKAGMSVKFPMALKFGSTLSVASDLVKTGTPLLFLDLRLREEVTARASRAEIIENAKTNLIGFWDALLAQGLSDIWDVGTLAYLHDALTEDGISRTTGLMERSGVEGGQPPLHEAIRRSMGSLQSSTMSDGKIVPMATQEQVHDVIDWFVDRFYFYAWQTIEDHQEREKQGQTYDTWFTDQMKAMSVYSSTLLQTANFYHLNLIDIQGSALLIDQLVKLDRLPKENTLQGLLLLQDAWRDYDVATYLASSNKITFKILFFLQILFGYLAIAGATLAEYFKRVDLVSEIGDQFEEVVFFLSLLVSLLGAIDALTQCKSKWRLLRSSAHGLESMLWQYRTRVGPFEIIETMRDSEGPENELCKMLNEWRDNLLAGANLKMSSLHQAYPARVYKHFQDSGQPTGPTEDDFQSPVQPHRYIKLRIEPALKFYQDRIPQYARYSFILQTSSLLLGIGATVLAYYKYLSIVVMCTSAAGAVTTWVEFSDVTRKMERYTDVVNGLRKILSWWKVQSAVQKASKETISALIQSSEAMLSEERSAWMSVAESKKDQAGQSEEEGGTKQTRANLRPSKGKGTKVAPGDD